MERMAKGKAHSCDGISDIIFRKKTWEKLWNKHCYTYNLDRNNIEEKKWYVEDVEDNLAEKL